MATGSSASSSTLSWRASTGTPKRAQPLPSSSAAGTASSTRTVLAVVAWAQPRMSWRAVSRRSYRSVGCEYNICAYCCQKGSGASLVALGLCEREHVCVPRERAARTLLAVFEVLGPAIFSLQVRSQHELNTVLAQRCGGIYTCPLGQAQAWPCQRSRRAVIVSSENSSVQGNLLGRHVSGEGLH